MAIGPRARHAPRLARFMVRPRGDRRRDAAARLRPIADARPERMAGDVPSPESRPAPVGWVGQVLHWWPTPWRAVQEAAWWALHTPLAQDYSLTGESPRSAWRTPLARGTFLLH